MPAYKDKAKGTWYASFYYEDWTGKKVKKMKRGFPTKWEALEWERTFLQQQTADLEMTFENFVDSPFSRHSLSESRRRAKLEPQKFRNFRVQSRVVEL